MSKPLTFQVAVMQNNCTTYPWFAPSESLRTADDTDPQAALLAAREWHWDAQSVELETTLHGFAIRSDGRLVRVARRA